MTPCDVEYSDSDDRVYAQCEQLPAWVVTVYSAPRKHDVYVYCSDHAESMFPLLLAGPDVRQIVATWINDPMVDISRPR